MSTVENNIIKKILLALPMTARLFRNSTGAAVLRDGRFIRYGLCVGSSDLIGWTTREITPQMVGNKVAIFTAIEVKTGDIKTTKEQKNFIDNVNASGGIAIEVRGENEIEKINGVMK